LSTISDMDAARLAKAAGATPGQRTIDGEEVPPGAPAPADLVVRGSTPLDLFNVGGKMPNRATVTFAGGKAELEPGTAFLKGDTIRFEGYATVVAATAKDKRDKETGIVLECELLIRAEIDDLQVVAG
jgi:hypothetical protein